MRKWMYIVLTCAVGMGTTTIKAQIVPNSQVNDNTINNDELVESNDAKGSNDTEESNDVGGTAKDETDLEDSDVEYLTRKLFNQILKEQNLEKLINEEVDTLPSQAEIAYMLCKLLQKSGVYLPDKENVSNPYVGRLMVLGIWQSEYKDGPTPVSEWGDMYGRALTYKISGEIIANINPEIETKMAQYRKAIDEGCPYETIIIGELNNSNYSLSNGVYTYPLYSFSNTNYVDINTLEALGYTVTKVGEDYYLTSNGESKELSKEPSNQKMDIMLGNERVFLEDVSSYVVKGESSVFVPVRFLEKDYNLTIEGKSIKIGKKLIADKSDFKYTEDGIIYEGDLPVEVETVTYYWDKSKLYEEINTYSLTKGDIIEINCDTEILRRGKYINTIIKKITTAEYSKSFNGIYGQNIEYLLNHYETTIQKQKLEQERLEKEKLEQERLEKERLEKEELEKQEMNKNPDSIFPSGAIMATVKYDTNGLNKGDKVELYMQGGGSYTVISDNGSRLKMTRGSLIIQPHTKVTASEASKYQIETFINEQNISSNTSYLVWTDIYRQTTYVLKGSKNSWELIKRMPCSTGENYTPTPRGFFELNAKVPSFGQNKGYCCKNAYGFIGSTYLYHSVLFDTSGTYITSGKKELGKEKASHGCIRLLPEDSLWLYNTMPRGTKVWIN